MSASAAASTKDEYYVDPAKVEELKGRISNSLVDDLTYRRFLIGHNGDVEIAYNHLVLALKWRKEFGADEIFQAWPESKDPKARLVQSTFPVGIVGHHQGRPVFLYRYLMADFPNYIEICGLDYLLRHTVYHLEKLLRESETGDTYMIMDLAMTKGFDRQPPITSIWQVSGWISYLMKYLNPLTKIADPYYPETSHRIFFTRAPTLFWGVWKVVSLLLAERTKQKVMVFTSDNADKDLLPYLPLSVIPDVLGGEASTAHLPKGGVITADMLAAFAASEADGASVAASSVSTPGATIDISVGATTKSSN